MDKQRLFVLESMDTMTGTIKAAIMFGFCFALSLSGADIILREEIQPGVRQKVVRVQSGYFTEAHVVALARSELARRPRANFLRLVVLGENGAPPLPQRSGSLDTYWLALYKSLPKKNEIAEMIAIGKDAVLRMQDPNGEAIYRILEGADPLTIEVDGQRLDIMWFNFTEPSSFVQRRAQVFLVTNMPFDDETGYKVLRAVDQVFPEVEVSVHISDDERFLAVSNYPYLNPFVANPGLTGEDILNKSKRGRVLTCVHWSSAPKCFAE